jgi:Thioredoxin-like
MKKITTLSVLLLLSFSVFAQVVFENLSYDGALQRSKETGKLVFLQFESVGCEQCNEVADKAFENKKLSETLEQTFICIKISADHPDRNKVASLYNKSNDGFGSMFIASDGTLIHNYPRSTTRSDSYQQEIDKALTKAGEGMRVSALEKEYREGNKIPALMELLIRTKKTLNLETDSLLQEYVSLLPADSLMSIRTLLFITEMAPVIGSKADSLLKKNYSVFIAAWSKMSLAVRVGINNRIIYKSMQKAIREKNESYAYRIAAFTRRTYDNNLQAGQKAYDSKLIDYYRQTNDTINYLIRSVYYYDNYYMTVSVDSIKRKDSLNMKSLFEKQIAMSEKNRNTVTNKKVIQYAPIVQNFTRDLNNAAFSFYQMTNDPLHLAKALQWSVRANEFSESYEAMDTHAHLLYKTGKKQEAIEWESRAIALKKKRGFDTKNLDKELSDMKTGKL